MGVDEYIAGVIRAGDDCSAILRAQTAPTLRHERVAILDDSMNGLAVLRPSGRDIAMHSACGDPGYDASLARLHTASMVERLVREARYIGAEPLAFSNVVEAHSAGTDIAREVGEALRETAQAHGVACLNGEFAVLGGKVTQRVNVSGTMVSELPEGHSYPLNEPFKIGGVTYCAIPAPDGKIYLNSDGQGTKGEFHDRARRWNGVTQDVLAMLLDDAVKRGARAIAVANVLELEGDTPARPFLDEAAAWSGRLNFPVMYQVERSHGRLRGYNEGAATFNASGTAVSVIDEHMLHAQPRPYAGDTLLAMRNPRPNPRCNGISGHRATMAGWLGPEWHATPQGAHFLEYLIAPATLFYPVFRDLLRTGLASSFYHMSGGAFEGKLARPLARYGLGAELTDLFEPDARERDLIERSGTSAQDAYAKWPVGNEGFVATSEPGQAMDLIRRHGLEAMPVGELRELPAISFNAYNGERVLFAGGI